MSDETDTGRTIMLVAMVSLYSTGHWVGATVLLGLVVIMMMGRIGDQND